MNYENIQNKIQYWIKYDGRGDEYRKKNDRDCQLTNGNLFADTLFSLWLPLRYTLDYCNSTGWNDIKLEAGKSKIIMITYWKFAIILENFYLRIM